MRVPNTPTVPSVPNCVSVSVYAFWMYRPAKDRAWKSNPSKNVTSTHTTNRPTQNLPHADVRSAAGHRLWSYLLRELARPRDRVDRALLNNASHDGLRGALPPR